MTLSDIRNVKIINHLNHICKEWLYYEEIGVKHNRPVGIKIRDDDAELLTDYVFDVKGTGGKSHGYDHTDGTETKVINLFQHKFCNSLVEYNKKGKSKDTKKCKAIGEEHKLHYKSEVCDLCGESKFIPMDDSRAGIDSRAHFNGVGVIPRYIIWILLSSNNVVTLKGYIFDSKNPFLNEILHEQLVNGTEDNNTKNFMPYGLEWYLSNPLLFAQYEFEIVDNCYQVKPVFFSLDNPLSEKIYLKEHLNPIKKNALHRKSDAKEAIIEILGDKDEYTYSEFVENDLVKINWKSTQGKKRGETKRRHININDTIIVDE